MRTGPHYDFDHYRQLVHEITQAFCGISKEVLEIKEKLHHEFDRPALSEHIEKLQSKEKQKLELVRKHSLYGFNRVQKTAVYTIRNIYVIICVNVFSFNTTLPMMCGMVYVTRFDNFIFHCIFLYVTNEKYTQTSSYRQTKVTNGCEAISKLIF